MGNLLIEMWECKEGPYDYGDEVIGQSKVCGNWEGYF